MPKQLKSKIAPKQKGGNENLPGDSVCAANQDIMLDYYSTQMKDNIYVDTQTSPGWYNQNDTTKMYSVDINAGYNNYMFTRLTPDGTLITKSNLDFHPRSQSFELVGGKKSKKIKEAKPKEAKPKEAKPKEAKPKDAKPKEAKPKDAKPKEAKTKDAKPKEAKPKEAKNKKCKKEVSLIKKNKETNKIKK